MRTNIDLDQKLIERGLHVSGLKTKKDLVHLALSEFLRKKDQKQILHLRGKIEWSGDLDQIRKSRFA